MSNNISAQTIAQYLGQPKRAGDGWLSRCPAHDDEHASLSVTDSNDTVLVHCHADCSQEAVIEELKSMDLWPTYESTSSDFATYYNYVDEQGELRYQVGRKPNKRFFQRRPDGRGSWIWNLKDVSKLPYRLPELLAGIQEGEPVFIVEGEKDADNLRKLGLVVTTNSGGAGKWTNQHSQYLKGASEALILPDNDDAGHKHGQLVALSLRQENVPVKIVALTNLPQKGDVSDWLEAGGTKEGLLALCNGAPMWCGSDEPPKEEISTANLYEIDWANPDTFGDPIWFGEIETPEITSDFLPGWVKDYVDALAASTQTPLAMATLLVLAILATCLQKRFEVSPFGDDYTEPLTLWVLVFLTPANRKSAVLEALRAPVIEWQRWRGDELASEIEKRKTQREIDNKRIEELMRLASKAEN
jgi:putative DNA primase/helicase